MTKTKTKIYLFIAALFFLNIFFVGINAAKAACEIQQNDYMACMGDDSLDESDCASFYSAWQNCESREETLNLDNETMDGASNTDCSDYANTYPVSGYCQCKDGYERNSDGSCSKVGPTAPLECRSDSECVTNYGAGFTCDNQGICQKGNSSGCLSDAQCVNSFGSGYKCDSSGTCMVDGLFDGTECRSDADCSRLYGSGFECKGVFVSTCERVASGNTSNGGSGNSPRPVATTTAPTNVNGKQIPAGTQVNSDGSATNTTTGQQVAPPGSFDVPSSINSGGGFVMCANGVLAPECRDIDGNRITAPPIVILGGNSGLGNGGPGNGGLGTIAGLSGANTPKCGTDGTFTDIGGVCFPTNTGLSSAPIYLILSNLFSWLMGLFTTLSVVAFVVSGIQYVTSAGSDDQMKTAKNNAKYSLIGIIIGLSGFVIIKAIAAALSGQGYFF